MKIRASLMLAAAAVAAWTAAADAKPLRWARGQDAPTLDPHSENSAVVFGVLFNIYEPLAYNDPTGAIVPGLATS